MPFLMSLHMIFLTSLSPLYNPKEHIHIILDEHIITRDGGIHAL